MNSEKKLSGIINNSSNNRIIIIVIIIIIIIIKTLFKVGKKQLCNDGQENEGMLDYWCRVSILYNGRQKRTRKDRGLYGAEIWNFENTEHGGGESCYSLDCYLRPRISHKKPCKELRNDKFWERNRTIKESLSTGNS